MSAYGPADLQTQLGLSDAAIARLEIYRALLADWSNRMNLIGPKELDLYWSRHVLDSAQLVRLAPDAKAWVDLGSGAGFPGLVIACIVADTPGASVHLVESTAKKCAFLSAVTEEAGLPAQIFNSRIEDFGAGEGPYDVVTARALAPLNRLIGYAKPILDRGAQGLFHKGADFDAELAVATSALKGGAYRADVLESLSDPRGRIIRVARSA
jgi:16S rRNA (guanine527-N7)-methyltransferase